MRIVSHWNSEIDSSFCPDRAALNLALDALLQSNIAPSSPDFGDLLPEDGIGEEKVLELLAPVVIGRARQLGDETAFAHMDPPTPWITWATSLWNAALNQNLLHPDVAPVAREIEDRLMQWLAPCYGMTGGHMTPGSTVANLTALWAARELRGIKTVVTSKSAHLSVAKSAHILGLELIEVETNGLGRIEHRKLPADLSNSALVLTAGTTSSGSLDILRRSNNAAWMHVDAAWAGPLRLSQTHREKLDGIEAADSVAISGHKWFFQPKESGLILFRDVEKAHAAISFGDAYLTVPNIGILGSHGANAIPLFATLLSWGRTGLEQRINKAMLLADRLTAYLVEQPDVQLFGANASGVVLWRFKSGRDVLGLVEQLPVGAASTTTVDNKTWIRHVAANPNVNLELLTDAIDAAIKGGK
jgi:L-2,4-diaminobutyrate decarboxylase